MTSESSRIVKMSWRAMVILICLVAGCGDDETPRDDETPKTITITDLDYEARRFFFLVDPVDPLLSGTLRRLDQGGVLPPVITDLQVWRDNRIQNDNGTSVPGTAYLDPRSGASAAVDSIDGNFDALRPIEGYTIRNDLFLVNEVNYPVLDILSPIGSGEVLAATFTATYTLPGGGTQVIRYGNTSTPGDPPHQIVGKALYIPDGEYLELSGDYYSRHDYWYPIRRLELRNIYALGDNIDLDTLDMVVKRPNSEDPVHFPADSTATYLRGLGIDRENTQGMPIPDDRPDARYVYPDLGMVVLPDLRPFAPAAEDSVWPFFVQDLPNGRPAFFVGEAANANPGGESFYDKRPGQIDPSADSKYIFEITVSP